MEHLNFSAPGNDPEFSHRRLIDAGGFGEVHEYHDKRTDQLFARKIIRVYGDSITRKEITDSIKNEARAIAKLCKPGQHRNIVAVFRQGEVKDTAFYYIDMELCDSNLEIFIRKHGALREAPVTMPQILEIMVQIVNGVAFIHDQNEVHRDLKPRNVLYSRADDTWKIADFDLTSQGTSQRFNTTRSARGTGGYRAPELVKDGKNTFNNKVDIWSMGCILYELITGQMAFASDWAVLQYLQRGDLPRLPSDNIADGRWELEVTRVLSSMLEVDPSRRHPARYFLSLFAFHYALAQAVHNYNPVIYQPSRPCYPFRLPDRSARVRCSTRAYFAIAHRSSGKISVWDAEHGMHELVLDHGSVVYSLAYAKHDPHLLASSAKNKSIILWNTQSGRELMRLKIGLAVTSMAFNYSANQLALGTRDGRIGISRVIGTAITPIESWLSGDRHEYPPSVLKYHRDDMYLCSSSGRKGDEIVRVWNTIDGTLVCRLDVGKDGVPGLFHPTQHEMLTPSRSGFSMWNVVEGLLVDCVKTHSQVKCCTYTPCGNYIIIGFGSDRIEIWSRTTRSLLHEIQMPLQVKEIWFCQMDKSMCVVLGESQIALIDFEDERRRFNF